MPILRENAWADLVEVSGRGLIMGLVLQLFLSMTKVAASRLSDPEAPGRHAAPSLPEAPSAPKAPAAPKAPLDRVGDTAGPGTDRVSV